MSQAVALKEQPAPVGVIADMAGRYGMVPQAFEATLRATVVPGNCSKEQFAAFLLVAREYSLNPLTKEIYAFPSRGGIQPIVSIDGWMKLMNSSPEFDGIEFEDAVEDGRITAITAKVFRKDRKHPVSVTEYLGECERDTDPWKKWPARMLRHKAAIQAARYAFGFSGILDPDEYDRFNKAPAEHLQPAPTPPPLPSEPVEAKPAQNENKKATANKPAPPKRQAANNEPDVEIEPDQDDEPAAEAESNAAAGQPADDAEPKDESAADALERLGRLLSEADNENTIDDLEGEFKDHPALQKDMDWNLAQIAIDEARERVNAQ